MAKLSKSKIDALITRGISEGIEGYFENRMEKHRDLAEDYRVVSKLVFTLERLGIQVFPEHTKPLDRALAMLPKGQGVFDDRTDWKNKEKA